MRDNSSRKLLFFIFLYTVLFLFQCAGPRPALVEDPPEKREAREVLIDATRKYLDAGKDADPETRNALYEKFKSALGAYLFITEPDDEATLQFEYDGESYVLPMRLLRVGPSKMVLSGGSPIIKGKSLDIQLKGEVLDLAWLPGENNAGNLIILFPDSLVFLPQIDEADSTGYVYRHPSTSLRLSTSAYPNGILAFADINNDKNSELLITTSSLLDPLALGLSGDQFSTLDSIDHPTDSSLPLAWSIPTGRDVFRPKNGEIGPFRSLRQIAGSNYLVLLNEEGYLQTIRKDSPETPREPVWQYKQPLGNRLFLLKDDRVAVCDSRRDFFTVFDFEEDSLKFWGQSPRFEGKVSAIIPATLDSRDGWLVSLTRENNGGQTVSNFYFLAENTFNWETPLRVEPLQFPDYFAKVSFLQEISEKENAAISNRELPKLVKENVYENLFQVGRDSSVAPLLAASASADSSQTVWTIRLADNIRFSDDSRLTAEDVVNSWKTNLSASRRIDNLTERISRWHWQDITGAMDFVKKDTSGISGLRIIDDKTLEVRLNTPRPYFTEHLTQSCFSIFKESKDGKSRLGTGPYRLKQLSKRSSKSVVSCERNEHYHRGRSPIDEIEFTFQTGNITDVLLSPRSTMTVLHRKKDVDYFRRINRESMRLFPKRPIYFLAINPASEMLKQRSHRLSIATALNRQVVSNIVTAGECEPASTFFDTYEARQSTSVRLSPQAFENILNISYRASDPVAQQIAERLAARLSQLGVSKHSLNALSDNAFESFRISGNYEILVDRFSPAFGTPLYNLAELMKSNYVVTASIRKSLETALSTKVPGADAEIERRLIENAILYPVVGLKTYAMVPPFIRDLRQDGTGHINFAKMWVPAN